MATKVDNTPPLFAFFLLVVGCGLPTSASREMSVEYIIVSYSLSASPN